MKRNERNERSVPKKTDTVNDDLNSGTEQLSCYIAQTLKA